MMPAISANLDPKRLFARFAHVRFRLRVVAILQGLLAVAAILVGGAALEGWMDWRWQLPSLMRAIALFGILGSAGYAFIRFMLIPLRSPADNMRLALALEARHPELNDVLASAVQFLEHPADEEVDSPLLRKITVRQALRAAEHLKFGDLLSIRTLRFSALGMVLALAITIPPIRSRPEAARIAYQRLVIPFGVGAWPAQTTIKIISPQRWPHAMALGDSLEMKVQLHGVIPDRATVTLWVEGSPPTDQIWVITPGPVPDDVSFVVHIDNSRISRAFRLKIRANDADTGWRDVVVKPPPELSPLHGRPSPQIRLDYPRYTDLSAKQLPDGASSFETIAGTAVELKAATNRPVSHSFIVYSPDHPAQVIASAFASLGSTAPLNALSSTIAGRTVWAPVPVVVGSDGRELGVSFMPRVAGTYALRFEDETGFGNTRLFDIRVIQDPAPAVALDRPNSGTDRLTVTKTADLPLQGSAIDTLFAVKSMWLDYRTVKSDANRQRILFDHTATGTAIPRVVSPFAPLLRLRWQNVQINGRLSIASIRHVDGSPLREGDTVVIQLAADDFDEIALTKQPGRSHEIELKIVSPATLDALLNRDQAVVRQNLLQLQQWQKEARERVDSAKELRPKNSDRVRPEDFEKLIQAEQLQQQIRGRIGNEKEGLRSDVRRIRQARIDNKLPASSSQDRMDAVGTELDRLAREELEPIEPLLNAARESADAPSASKNNENRPPDALAQALKHQKEVEQTLANLLQSLEPWSGANELRGETRAVLTEQEKLLQDTDALADRAGKTKAELTEQQKTELDALFGKQEGLAAQMKELVDKIGRVAQEKQAQAATRDAEAEKLNDQARERERLSEQAGNETQKAQLKREAEKLKSAAEAEKEAAVGLRRESEALKDAAKVGTESPSADRRDSNAPQRLDDVAKKASKNIQQNQLGDAKLNQKQTIETMKQMLGALEETRKDDLDRLAKKLRETEKRLDELADQQERLQKKVKEAQAIADPSVRQQELQKLARDQERLKDETRDLAQQLSRLQAKDAAEAAQKAAREMADAAQRLERGENPDSSQEDALRNLDDAQNNVEKSREQVEESLLREKLAKIADRIKGVRDRQQGAIKEAKRIQGVVLRAKAWAKPVQQSLLDLGDLEENLATELDGLSDQRFKDLKVIAKLMEQSASAMRQSTRLIQSRNDDIKKRLESDPFDPITEEQDHSELLKSMELAGKRLDQFLDAIKADQEMVQSAKAEDEEKSRKPMSGMGSGGESDGIPQLAQLRALRMLQAEVNTTTERFAKDHPDATKLTERDKIELESIRQMQRDIADLVREFSPPEEPKGGQR